MPSTAKTSNDAPQKKAPKRSKAAGIKANGKNNTSAFHKRTESASERERNRRKEDQESIFNNLLDADIQFWHTVSEDDRKDFYETVQKFYHATLEEFRNGANDSVKQFKEYRAKHIKWRLTLIILTGGLAVLNVLVAYKWPIPADPLRSISANQVLSLFAAIYASILALLTTIESFFKYPDQKATARESRELYLDAYRTHEMMWLAKVYAFGYSVEGCFNAAVLYRQLVTKDVELRRKMIDLSETQEKKATK